MRKLSGQGLYAAMIIAGSCLAISYFAVVHSREAALGRPLALDDIPFDGARAFEYLQQLCELGPRPSGSPAMEAQQDLLIRHFQELGAVVTRQSFRARHPQDGSAVNMVNLVIEWHPERRQRVLLGAHYDTRPFPDRDDANPRGTFVGANDGASGVALLMELARHMPELPGALGVDFVLFDGEELVIDERGEYFLGSSHFAREHASRPPAHRYRWGIVLDMVGDLDLQIYQEVNSLRWEETRPLVHSLWGMARRLRVREFIARPMHEVRDDHLPLRNIAHIPTCDVIDFDYPHWHTEGDTPDNCSAISLAKVGWVVHEWLKSTARQKR